MKLVVHEFAEVVDELLRKSMIQTNQPETSRGGSLGFCVLLTVLISFSPAAGLRAEFVYVGGLSSISGYKVREDGVLVAVGASYPVAGGAGSVTVDPVGRVVYMLSGGGTGFITALSVGEKGGLTPVPGSLFPTQTGPTNLAIDILGRFVYVPTHGGSLPEGPADVDGYSIGANGALTPVPGSPFQNVDGKSQFAATVDPVSRSLYVTNLLGGGVRVFAIGSKGTLAADPHRQFPAGLLDYSLTVSV